MEVSSLESTTRTLGERIRKARLEQGLTQEKLAGPEFTKGYVSALERGTVRPSLKALEVFSRRLSIPISDFLAARQAISTEPDLSAVEEDLRYQATYAKMLIRTGQIEEALELMVEAEQNAAPYLEKLAADVRYLVPFVRGRAYLRRSQPSQARPEFEAALDLAKGDEEAIARVRNILGVVFYVQELPQLALQQHLQCMDAIRRGAVKDLSLQLSIYRNLANNYWAVGEVPQAIGIYKEALRVLEDLNDLERQAGVFWGLAEAYEEAGDWSHAKLYATRALNIYEAADNRVEAASICMHLAEILTNEQRYEEAEQLLERARGFLVGTGSLGALSSLYRDYADLARKAGQTEEAAQYARESVQLAEQFIAAAENNYGYPSNEAWQHPTRIYVEALHVAALIEEEQGNTEDADRLFQEALKHIKHTELEETIRAISFSYADVLKARGAYEQAMEYYRAAAQSHARPTRSGMG